MIWARDWTDPSAYFTPGTARTFGRTLSGTGFSSCPPPPPGPPPSVGLKTWCACTTTSMFEYASPNKESKLASAVSVRMNVPAVNPTPRTTASAVRTRRSFRASRLLIVARNIEAQVSRDFRRSRIRSAVGSCISSTAFPSLRKTTRSANPAALASCVTITMVCP